MNWGIIGCGLIAGEFAESLEVLDGAEIVACASRTQGKAAAFAGKHHIRYWYDDYEGLLADDRVEVVYVATTHNFHYANVLQCLEAGKHVLCEKAFTVNARQARHLRDVAASKQLFLMEAMWTRFLPATKAVISCIEQGEIGDVLFLKADFSILLEKNPKHRLYNPYLAGGALLDLGVYPLSFSHMVFGRAPISIYATGSKTMTGVDERTSFQLDFGEGKGAQLSCNINLYETQRAVIGGSEGWIEMEHFLCAESFTLHIGRNIKTYEYPFTSTGKYHEAMEVERCIKEGRLESQEWPLAMTIGIMEEMDEIRRQTDLVYPEALEQL